MDIEKKKKIVFVFRDENDCIVCSVSRKDIEKRVPKGKGFEFKKLSRKNPSALPLFTTKECEGKYSLWIENWNELEINKVYYAKCGWNVEKQHEDHVDMKKFVEKLNGKNRKQRAQQFLELEENDQKQFFKLSVKDQITLLLVPNKMQSQFSNVMFTFDHLLRYAEHVSDTDNRRRREKEQRIRKEEEEHKKWTEMQLKKLAIESDDIMGSLDIRDTFKVDPGISRYTHHIDRKRETDVFGLAYLTYSMEMMKYTDEEKDELLNNFSLGNDVIYRRHKVPIKERVTQSQIKATERVIDGIDDAWWTYRLDTNMLHKIWFFFCLAYIRSERKCDRKCNEYMWYPKIKRTNF